MDGRRPRDGTLPPSASTTSAPSVPSTPSEPVARYMERRASAGNLRTASNRPAVADGQATVRSVTPEPPAHERLSQDATRPLPYNFSATLPMPGTRPLGPLSPQSSPRSVPGAGPTAVTSSSAGRRRQGVVFNDAMASSFDSASSTPPARPSAFRPRTRTMDGAFRQQLAPAVDSGSSRHRVGSVSSSGSLAGANEERKAQPLPPLQSTTAESKARATIQIQRTRSPDVFFSSHPATTAKEKKTSTRTKLMKRSSRPTSPLMSAPPSIDSLPLPIPTDDANKVLALVRVLCGRMRGEVECQNEPGGPWYTGVCYIEEDKGSLMFDPGENGPFHVPMVPDLRGCRVVPVDDPAQGLRYLELVHAMFGVELLMRPLRDREFDLWLAALICWQQLRPPPGTRLPVAGPATPAQGPPELKRRGSSTASKEASVIKVGKVMLWDKGCAASPRHVLKRPSTRDLRSNHMSWKKVSCILQDNGEFKLITENDVTVLSVIDLSQLNRCAVQQLDKSVLDEEFCIAIFPSYSSASTRLSILRPVYLALDTRVLFEVWFVLLRAFTVPEIYAISAEDPELVTEVTDLEDDAASERFRVEKIIVLRVTEAKIRSNTLEPGQMGPHERQHYPEQDRLIGNYLAEVILDGEVRARTTTKTGTKNPFWRDECEFSDLSASLPCLTIVLKRVDGNLESTGHQQQGPLGQPKTGNLVEMPCGTVDVPLSSLERGKDHEQWFQIYDDKPASIGSMLVKVRHEELVVLMAKEYQPLSELLHNFSSNLTGQIAEAVPGNLRRLAEIFLNIFQVSGSAGEWLMAMVEDEIDGIGTETTMKKMRYSRRMKSNDSMELATDRELLVRDMGKSLAGEANLLFRGNSLLTQALEFHMRRLGKEYLEDILSDKIFEINEINPDCEVDPGKLHQGEDLQQHWNQLMLFTNEVWDCIAGSAHKLPPELRHILKYIRAVAEDRYGDFLRTVAYTSVSGFLFLRFICPAILNPKLFGLLRDHPRPRAQRTLTLIAKGLQALANLSAIGKKETWMEPMNRFLGSHRPALKDYIDQVCAIPVERTSYTVPASYSTPITILGRLSPTSREGFPSLPYLIDHSRNFAALVRLWMSLNPIANFEAHMFDGALLDFSQVCAQLQNRSDACSARVEARRAAAAAAAETSRQPIATDSELALAEAMEAATLVGASGAAWAADLREGGGAGAQWPPGSSGSDADNSNGGGGTVLREFRLASSRDPRDTPDASEAALPGGTVRSLRSGNKQARKFLSGLRRKGRPTSPDPCGNQNESGGGREKDKDKDNGVVSRVGWGAAAIGAAAFPEAWQRAAGNTDPPAKPSRE